MILLLGGTSETVPIAQALADAGFRVLVSNCTDVPQNISTRPAVSLRTGPLDLTAMLALTDERGITAIVDTTHPYAIEVKQTARKVCEYSQLPYFRFARPPLSYDQDNVCLAADHTAAAEKTCSFKKPILLTIGSGNLAPYVDQANKNQLPLFARVLNFEKSIEKCTACGIPKEFIIAARGPFSLKQNRDHIRTRRIGVLVTKDSGKQGGVTEKLQAAKMENCQVIVVKRPAEPTADAFQTVEKLIQTVKKTLPNPANNV